MVRSPDREIDIYDIVTQDLLGYTLKSYMFLIYQDYVQRCQ